MRKHNVLTLLAVSCMLSGTALAIDRSGDTCLQPNLIHAKLFLPEQHPEQLIPKCACCACEEFKGYPLLPEGDYRSINTDMSPRVNLR